MAKRPDWCPRFLRSVSEGLGPCISAELAGVDKTTPYSYADDHADFRADWAAAKEAARKRDDARFERRLRQLAGGADTSAQLSQPPRP